MYRWNKVADQASATKDQRHELEVYVGEDPHQRSLRSLELVLIILIKFATNLYS